MTEPTEPVATDTVDTAPPLAPSAREKIAAAVLPERAVEICLHADLQATYEDLERQLAEEVGRQALDQRLNPDRALANRLAAEIEALQEQMRERAITVRLRALPRRRWAELMDQHPAREGNNDDQVIGYNADGFFPAAIRACAVEPAELDDSDWATLLDERITVAQYNQLVDAVMALNVRKISVPNSRAASRILQGSEPE